MSLPTSGLPIVSRPRLGPRARRGSPDPAFGADRRSPCFDTAALMETFGPGRWSHYFDRAALMETFDPGRCEKHWECGNS